MTQLPSHQHCQAAENYENSVILDVRAPKKLTPIFYPICPDFLYWQSTFVYFNYSIWSKIYCQILLSPNAPKIHWNISQIFSDFCYKNSTILEQEIKKQYGILHLHKPVRKPVWWEIKKFRTVTNIQNVKPNFRMWEWKVVGWWNILKWISKPQTRNTVLKIPEVYFS